MKEFHGDCDITLITLFGYKLLPQFDGINFSHINLDIKKLSLFSIIKSVNIMRKQNIDIVYAYDVISTFMAILGFKLKRGVKIISSRRNLGHWRSKKHNPLAKFTNLFSDVIIGNSSSVMDLIRSDGFSVGKEILINNGIKIKPYSYKKLNDLISILTVSNLRQVKNISLIINAFPELLKRFKKIEIVCIGDGNQKKELIELSKNLNVFDKISFEGIVDNVDKYYEKADIFVLPSLSEGSSNSLIEAMNSSIPVIGSNVPGINDMITDKYNGMLIDPKRAATLIDAITELITNNDFRKRISRNGHKYIKEKFSLKNMIDNHAKIFDLI
tara:strand:- start:1325 stop:2308 length:984 start_codon:yes stop_codon:yes gene_type:complete